MKLPRSPRALAVLLGAGLVLGVGGGATYAAFSSTTGNGGNSLSAAADLTAPTDTSVIQRQSASAIWLAGRIQQNQSYFVYANVTDTGNPASGVNTVNADVSNITTGATSVALTTAGGPWSVQGTSYSYRSAARTSNNPLAGGSKTYTITATDNATNSSVTSFSVTVDNTVPAGSDVQIVNGSGTAGRPDNGDVVTLTFNDQIEPMSVLAGWNGTATAVTVRVTDGGGGNDSVTIRNAANTAQLPLGSVNLGRTDYVTTTRNFTSSTMTQSGSAITIVMGGGAAGTTAAATGTMVWTPSATATDGAGNACSTAATTESGAADKEF